MWGLSISWSVCGSSHVVHNDGIAIVTMVPNDDGEDNDGSIELKQLAIGPSNPGSVLSSEAIRMPLS